MNWDAIGAVGEILGATGVIITLLYLATQIRQNTRQARATSFQTLTESGATINAMIVGDEDMARIWNTCTRGDPEKLSPEDWTRFEFALGSYLEAMESIFMQHKLGSAHEELFESRMEMVRVFLGSVGGRRAWPHISFTFSKSFRDYVETNLM